MVSSGSWPNLAVVQASTAAARRVCAAVAGDGLPPVVQVEGVRRGEVLFGKPDGGTTSAAGYGYEPATASGVRCNREEKNGQR